MTDARAVEPPGPAPGRERAALRFSMLVSVGFAVVALAWGLAANSQVILLDAVYTPLGLVFTLVAMRISRLAAAQPSRRYPFGRDALIPLFVVVQGVFLLGMLAYAGLEATG